MSVYSSNDLADLAESLAHMFDTQASKHKNKMILNNSRDAKRGREAKLQYATKHADMCRVMASLLRQMP